VHRVLQKQQDAAPGTEFQSRLGEDAARQERSGADAAFRVQTVPTPAAVQAAENVVLPAQTVPKAARDARVRDARQPARVPAVARLRLPRALGAPRAVKARELPEPTAEFRQAAAERLHGDATAPAYR
jgi:hypothetical protein